MSETIKVEIPISAKDNTGPAIESAKKKLNGLEKQAENLSKSLDKVKKTRLEISADDNASGKIDGVLDRAEEADGLEASVTITTNDSATSNIDSVRDQVNGLNGESGTAQIDVDDSATPVVRAAQDAVEGLGGVSGTAEIDVDDAASGKIDAATDKAESWAGRTFTATLAIADTVTKPVGKAAGMVMSPITQAAGIAGVSFGIADSVDTFKEFESVMSNVHAISGATNEDMAALTQQAKALGASTKFTSAQVGEGFSYMAMAGWDVQQMTAGIAPILNLAAASGEALGSVSDIVTDALTAFGMQAGEAGRFADVLAATSSGANTNVSLMGETFKYAGAMAGSLGYSIEDVALASGLMANAGIKGSMAGTALNSIMSRLATNTSGARDAIEELGIGFFDESGTARDFGSIMDDLRMKTAGMTQEQKANFANTVAGLEAQKGLLAILNAEDDAYNDLRYSIEHSSGAAQEMADIMLDNLAGSFTLLQSAVDGVKTTLGERTAPYLQMLTEWTTEQMPSIQDGIEKFSNKFNGMFNEMMRSDEWQNAGTVGKINIAWDKLIADPFKKWAGTEGANMISSGITSMFTSAGKVITGQGQLTDWLETAVLARGAVVATKGVMQLATAASALNPAFGVAIPVIAGAAAAIGSVSAAIDAYNQKQVENSLLEHFGTMKLSAQELVDVADHVIDAQYLVHATTVLDNVDGINELRTDIEGKLNENDRITWKASIGMKITDDEVDTYINNEKAVIKGKLEQLELEEQTAKILINVAPDTGASRSVSSQIDDWIKADQLEFTNLQSQITEKLSQAFHDGIADMDILSEVDALQSQMDELLNAWNVAQSQAAHDMLEMKYGAMSAEQLSAGGFSDLISQIHTTLVEDQTALDAETQSYLSLLHSWENSGRITYGQRENLASEWAQAERNARGSSIANAINFESNTLQNTYGDQIAKSIESVYEGVQSGMASIQGRMDMDMAGMIGADMQSYMSEIFAGNGEGGWFHFGSDADQSALNGIWEQLKPDATAITSLMDEYVNAGQAIPTALKESFMSAMEVGAAAGDEAAAWQVYANSIAASGNEAMIAAINEADLAGGLPEEFSKAWKRAAAEVTDTPLELDGVKAELTDVEVDAENISSAIEDAANGESEVTATTDITAEAGDVDASSAFEATVEATQEKFSETIDADTKADITLSQENNVDAIYSEVDGQVQGTFASGYSTTADVAVSLNWHITNPNAHINIGSNGLTASASISAYADGGRLNGAELLVAGEDGAEFLIPVSGKHREEGMALWKQAGEELGAFDEIPAYADGGAVNYSGYDTTSTAGESVSAGGPVNVPVSINVNPSFTINSTGSNEDQILQIIRAHMEELADEIGGEIADRLDMVFGNMPLAGGA